MCGTQAPPQSHLRPGTRDMGLFLEFWILCKTLPSRCYPCNMLLCKRFLLPDHLHVLLCH